MKIKCEYKDGRAKEIIPENKEVENAYKRVIDRFIECYKKKKGVEYFDFKNSNLMSIYVDDELVLQKEEEK